MENMEKKTSDWIRPNLEKERGEIQRVLIEFLGKEPTEENIKLVLRVLESSTLVDLSEEDWQVLENTDSFHNIRPGHVEDAEKITEEYNLELNPDNRRDFKTLLSSFQNARSMEAPTILRNHEGKLHLVSGNTRLMISRALNIRPKVVIADMVQ